jgi:hypothetical protein
MFGLVSNQQVLTSSRIGKASSFDLLNPLRHWLNCLEIQRSSMAHRICRVVPSQCPFERDIIVLGQKVTRIPPLCKLNPLYEELVSLRFRALCYLADVCGEDIQCYC